MNVDLVVVGLGNPGPRYALTRHNFGFILIDFLAENENFNKKWGAHFQTIEFASHKLLLLKPQTYMNLSGETLQKLYSDHPHLKKIPLVVIHDEVDLSFGRIKFKFAGGLAGHNGLKSIAEKIGNSDFYRLRMGVGKTLSKNSNSLADHVLEKFTSSELENIPYLLNCCSETLKIFLTQGFEAAQAYAGLIGNTSTSLNE